MLIINSITDVITNSSTSVFVVHRESDIDSIKELVNAILSINGNYTFDDLFNIEMVIDLWCVEHYLDDLVDGFDEKLSEECIEDVLDSYSLEKKNALISTLWELIDRDNYNDSYQSPYEGIMVTPKKDVAKEAAKLISNISNMFELGYSYN